MERRGALQVSTKLLGLMLTTCTSPTGAEGVLPRSQLPGYRSCMELGLLLDGMFGDDKSGSCWTGKLTG